MRAARRAQALVGCVRMALDSELKMAVAQMQLERQRDQRAAVVRRMAAGEDVGIGLAELDNDIAGLEEEVRIHRDELTRLRHEVEKLKGEADLEPTSP